MEIKALQGFEVFGMKPMKYHPIYALIAGKASYGIVLGKLIEYHYNSHGKEFPKTNTEIALETGLNERIVNRAKTKLAKKGFITITLKGLPRKTYYKVHLDKIEDAIKKVKESLKKEGQ